MVISWLFGPFRPWILKRKIVLAGSGVALLLGGLVANYYAAPHHFNGAACAWMLNFSLISLLVFGVSAYSLSIAHFLADLNDALMAGAANRSDRPGGALDQLNRLGSRLWRGPGDRFRSFWHTSCSTCGTLV
jgi:hypothetical protein